VGRKEKYTGSEQRRNIGEKRILVMKDEKGAGKVQGCIRR